MFINLPISSSAMLVPLEFLLIDGLHVRSIFMRKQNEWFGELVGIYFIEIDD